MSLSARRQAGWAGIILLALLFVILIGGLLHLRGQLGLGWANTFLFLLIVFQLWNLIDLLVLD